MGKNNRTIEEFVNLLHATSPETLELLRSQLPSALTAELVPGGTLGFNDGLLEARCEVAIAALSKYGEIAEVAIVEAASRLARARNWRFISEIISLLGSAGVLASLGMKENAYAVVTGTLALLGSVATLFAEQIVRVPLGGNESLHGVYTKLTDGAYKASSIRSELSVYKVHGIHEANEKRIEDLLVEATAVCREINTMQSPLLPLRNPREPNENLQGGGRPTVGL